MEKKTEIDAAWLHRPPVKALAELFGNRLRFVGGAVRDALLGMEAQDVDAAVALPPEETLRLLKGAGLKAVPTGIAHGTVTAVMDGHTIEITTLRHDIATDGRRAKVRFTDDWREDAARRDFTMNALYCDIDGKLWDYFGGIEDARAGRVRFIGDANTRIGEDYLRILRFFRFHALYGKGRADEKALAACRNGAEKLNTLSGERIRQEMLKLLYSPRAAEVIDVMNACKVLEEIMPSPVSSHALAGMAALRQACAHTQADPLLALALLLRSVPGDVATHIAIVSTRWRLSKAETRLLERLCMAGALEGNAGGKAFKKRIRALGREDATREGLLLAAEGSISPEQCKEWLELACNWEIPRFPVSGDDLLAAGVPAGKEMGRKLAMLEHVWEERNYIPDKQALLKLL